MKRILPLLLLLLLVTLGLTGCVYDGPPKDDSPEPPSLKGTYSGECGEFVFNGDGKSISFTLSPEVAQAAGLPESGEGEYVFTLHHSLYRYDKAEEMEIICGEASGRFMNRHGVTNEESIVLFSPIEDDTGYMTFERSVTE